MKRVRMTLDEIRAESTYYLETHNKSAGICALVDVENMGFCKDGKTRWYHFTSVDGVPAYTLKR